MPASKRTSALLLLALSVVCANALAQASATIDEIAELNRKKVVADLKKQIESSKLAEVDLKPVATPVLESKKVDPADLIPDVTAIFGPRPDQLSAMLSSPGQRDVRVVSGDVITGGWVVERINTGHVVFRSDEVGTSKASSKRAPKRAVSTEAAPTYRRVTVAVGSQRHPRAVSTIAGAPAQVASLPLPSPLPLSMMQLPTPLPVPAPSGVR